MELPPAVRRHLAREGCYAEQFAFDDDERIAVEVEPFLVGDVLDRVAKAVAESERLGKGKRPSEKLLKKMSPEKLETFWQEVAQSYSAVRSGSVGNVVQPRASGFDPAPAAVVSRESKPSHGSQALLNEVERKLGPLSGSKEEKSQPKEILRCKNGHEYAYAANFRFCPIDGLSVD
jgi:hypothetical protein